MMFTTMGPFPEEWAIELPQDDLTPRGIEENGTASVNYLKNVGFEVNTATILESPETEVMFILYHNGGKRRWLTISRREIKGE